MMTKEKLQKRLGELSRLTELAYREAFFLVCDLEDSEEQHPNALETAREIKADLQNAEELVFDLRGDLT